MAPLLTVHDGAPFGFNPSLRIYRYAVHEVFGSHYDDYAVTDAGVTAFTFLLYLTGDEQEPPVVGGETAFFGACSAGARARLEGKPERGAALMCAPGPGCEARAAVPARGGGETVVGEERGGRAGGARVQKRPAASAASARVPRSARAFATTVAGTAHATPPTWAAGSRGDALVDRRLN